MSHCTHSADSHSHGHSHEKCHGHSHGHDEHHVVSWQLLTAIFGALMVLTFLTVAAITIDLGPYNVVLAILIAAVKGFLVVYYFMHLKWDRAFHALCVVLSVAFVIMMIAYTSVDTHQFSNNIHVVDKAQERATPQP